MIVDIANLTPPAAVVPARAADATEGQTMSGANGMSAPAEIIMLLPNAIQIPRVEHDEFRREVEDALRWLPPGVTCRIDHLVTPKFWLPKSHRQRRLLGRVLAYWVANGELPLEFVGNPRRGNKRYRRKT